MADGHRQLETLGRKMGLDVTAFGDVLKPPSEGAARGLAGIAA
ncbi:hypothetical protein ACFSLT_29095 [Novosphingobium resinovorum]